MVLFVWTFQEPCRHHFADSWNGNVVMNVVQVNSGSTIDQQWTRGIDKVATKSTTTRLDLHRPDSFMHAITLFTGAGAGLFPIGEAASILDCCRHF